MRIHEYFEKDGPVLRWWNSPRFGAPLWLASAGLLIFWHFQIPPPGYAIGAVGVVAGIMSVRDMKVLGRIGWILLLVLLLVTEFRAIDKDRADSAREFAAQRKEQDDKFQNVLGVQNKDFAATAQSLEQTYSQSQKQFSATMGGISREIDTVTGGNSYIVFTYVPDQRFLYFGHVGNYTLTSVLVRIVDLDSPTKDFFGTMFPLQDLTRGHGLSQPVPAALNRPLDKLDLNVFFTAHNGDWTEQFRARRTGDGWTRAIRVQGAFSSMTKGAILCETIDKGFPIDTLDKDFKQLPLNPGLPRCQ